MTNERPSLKTSRSDDFSGYLAYFGTVEETGNGTWQVSGIRFDLEPPYQLYGERGIVKFEATDESSDNAVDRKFIERASLLKSQAYLQYIYGDSRIPAQTMLIITIFESNKTGRRVPITRCFDISEPTGK